VDPDNELTQILWGSPLPPIRSGVADYALDVLPDLAKSAAVRVLSPPDWSPADDWPDQLDLVPADADGRSGEVAVIHLGNNPHHVWLLDRLRRSGPTVVVLHDAVLHHLLVESTAALGDQGLFASSLEAAHGRAGTALAAARALGVQGHLDPFLFPARSVFLESVDGVIVHSEWAAELVRRELPEIAVGRVGLTVADPEPINRAEVRARLGLQPDEAILMHLGFLTPEKGLAEILTGVAAANRAGVAARLVVVGEGRGVEPLRRAATEAGIDDCLVFTGWVEAEDLPGFPAAADLGVVYRTPSAGETSAAALRFLACGVPVAVGGVRQFLELPEPVAPRLTPGPPASAELARLLAQVGEDGWSDRRVAARKHYEAFHRPEHSAREILAFLKTVHTT
jgi:glycosyltransferase involved in cell wall biosynthesis